MFPNFALQKPFFNQNTHKSWSNWQYFPSYGNLGTENSNLGSNFKPEVDLWPSELRMHSKNGEKWSKM